MLSRYGFIFGWRKTNLETIDVILPKATSSCMNEKMLGAAILNEPENAELYLELADCLLANGDPRGHLIQLDYAASLDPDHAKYRDRFLEHYSSYFMGNLETPRSLKLEWSFGYIHRASLHLEHDTNQSSYAIAKHLFTHPSARFLHTLTVEFNQPSNYWGTHDYTDNEYRQFDFNPVVRALAESGPLESVKKLQVGRGPLNEDDVYACDFSAVWQNLPGLHHVEIDLTEKSDEFERKNVKLGQIIAPDLKHFVLSTSGLRAANRQSLYHANWPNLETLSLCANAPELFANDQDYKGLKKLKHLTHLELKNNHYRCIPPGITTLSGLTTLNLSDNELHEVNAIVKLPLLESLNLQNNSLRDVSPIATLTQLKSLQLAKNKLEDIRPICTLPLESLDLSNNKLSALPAEIKGLGELTSLCLSGNTITKGKGLSPLLSLTQLCSLHFAYNDCGSLPKDFCRLKNLETLILTRNKLLRLPPDIIQLTALRTLDLASNRLSVLPERFEKLSLERLMLGSNRFTEIPLAVCNMRSLIELDMGSNEIEVLPPHIGQLVNLIHLVISHNKNITAFPDEIVQLSKLQFLDFNFGFEIQTQLCSAEVVELLKTIPNLERYFM